MTHTESLTLTDSQAKMRNQLQGFLHRCKQAKYIIHIAIYLNVLAPIRQLSLSFQQNQHNPVKAVKRIKDFTWTMAKLTLLIDQSLESNTGSLTFYFTNVYLQILKKNQLKVKPNMPTKILFFISSNLQSQLSKIFIKKRLVQSQML